MSALCRELADTTAGEHVVRAKKLDGPDADRPSIQATVTRRLALKSHWIFHEGQEERGIGGVGDMLDPGDMTAEEFYNDM